MFFKIIKQISSAVIIAASLFTVIAGVPQHALPLALHSLNREALNLYEQKSSLLSASRHYTLRGDWEPPDILLMVENEDWQLSLERIAAAAHQDGTPAYILVDKHDSAYDSNSLWLNKLNKERIIRVAVDSPWIRDYGPLQIKAPGNKVRWLDFDYSDDRPFDDTVSYQVGDYLKIPIEKGGYQLDGGAVISNGTGLCAITRSSLEEAAIDASSAEDVDAFQRALGCSALAVLPALTGESTGHADIIAQFLAPDIVAVSNVRYFESSEISAELDKAVDVLAAAADTIGQTLRVVRLPMYVDGEDFYSYVNGTRLREAYLVPSFDMVPPEMEFLAYRILNSVLPGVRVVPIPADEMVHKGGAVHCITLGLSYSRPAGLWSSRVREDNKSRPFAPSPASNQIHISAEIM